MNLRFLGDALDCWKGALFASLREAKALRDFAVDPMASDAERWQNEDFNLFARLLQVHPEQVIRHRASLHSRAAYFAEIPHRGDLFLDPDIGVATGRLTEMHLGPSEVGQLLVDPTDRLLIIYQHVRGRSTASRVNQVIIALRQEIRDISACTYESGTVAMLFVARNGMRTKFVANHFKTLLGRHAISRIRRFQF